jgi:hypothetical protein
MSFNLNFFIQWDLNSHLTYYNINSYYFYIIIKFVNFTLINFKKSPSFVNFYFRKRENNMYQQSHRSIANLEYSFKNANLEYKKNKELRVWSCTTTRNQQYNWSLYSKYPFQNKRDWDQLIIDVRQYKDFYEHKTVKVWTLMLDSTMPLHFKSVNMEVNSK